MSTTTINAPAQKALNSKLQRLQNKLAAIKDNELEVDRKELRTIEDDLREVEFFLNKQLVKNGVDV